MTQEEVAAKIDTLCGHLEDLIAEFTAEAAKRPHPYARIRETYPNAGKAWSKDDDEELQRLFAAGNSIADLSLLFGRTQNGVRQRLERLGIVLPAIAAAA